MIMEMKLSGGSDDLYIEVTASSGNPTYQYGLEITARLPDKNDKIPDGMDV